MNFKVLIMIGTILMMGCATGKEAMMTFRNMAYTGARIFPVKNNEADFSFRVWINNATSIERVITVT